MTATYDFDFVMSHRWVGWTQTQLEDDSLSWAGVTIKNNCTIYADKHTQGVVDAVTSSAYGSQLEEAAHVQCL